MSTEQARLSLSRLLAEEVRETPQQPYSVGQFCDLVERVLQQHGLTRIFSERDLPTWTLRMFLCMARHTYQRLNDPAPSVPEELLQGYRQALITAPETKGEFAQARIDPASACRRALTIHRRLKGQGRVLILGDDDGIGVALRLIAPYQVTVVDLDDRILDWTHRCAPEITVTKMDVHQVRPEFIQAFEAVAADPIRDPTGLAFIEAAMLCLVPGGHFFWADHPDWNTEFERFLDAASGLLRLEETHLNWHSYPARLPAEARAEFEQDEESQRFLRLSDQIQLWSNLYVLTRTPS